MTRFTLLLIGAHIAVFGAALSTAVPEKADFPSFYSAGRLWREGAPIYDLDRQCAIQKPIVPNGQCLLMAHAPMLIPLTGFLSTENYRASYWRWVAFLIIVWAACVFPLYYLTRSLGNAALAILFIPLFLGVVRGQETPFMVLSVLFWLLLLQRNRPLWAGVALSFLIIKPHLAILLGFPLLFSRPKAFLGFVLGSTFLSIYSMLLIGFSGVADLFDLLTLMAQRSVFGIFPERMYSVTGLLARLNISLMWSWAFFGLGVAAISFLWRKGASLGIGIVLALFVSPHLHAHDLALLLVPAVLVDRRSPVIVSVVWLSGFLVAGQYAITYLLFIVLIILLAIRGRSNELAALKSSPTVNPPFINGYRSVGPFGFKSVSDCDDPGRSLLFP